MDRGTPGVATMKIALFDPYLLKFTSGMVKWWVDHGHEVKYERYYNPELVHWADVIFFHTCDNNLKCATNPGDNPDFAGYDMHEMDLNRVRRLSSSR
jgi:sugar phosphate isomerase/epimerase